jgi:hypothetical protein
VSQRRRTELVCGFQTTECVCRDSVYRRRLDDLRASTLSARSVLSRVLRDIETGLRISVRRKSSNKTPVLVTFAFCFLFSACGTRIDTGRPSIEFTRVPPADSTRTDKLDIIQGRVNGAHPGQRIILYTKTQAWWIQPLYNHSFSEIQPDSTWVNSTHLGEEYAALLVEPSYRPKQMMYTLPVVGGEVVAIATVKGATSGPTTAASLQFSGYEWRVRNAPSARGDTVNDYDPGNAWTDTDGALHLRIAKKSGKWTCAEVTLTRSLGYGSYSFVVRDVSHLEPAVVFAMFTFDYAGGNQNNREMDIEISRWGDTASKNAQYDVQPFYVPANVARFTVPGGALTHSFHWERGRVSFRTERGSVINPRSEAVSEQVFTSGVPSPGAESVRMALYVYGNTDNPVQNDTEVVVEKFEYLP